MPKKKRKPPRILRWLPLLLLIAAAGPAFLFVQTRIVHLRRADIYLADLPEQFDGTTILYASDFYAGPIKTSGGYERLLTSLSLLEPDMIILGGGYAVNTSDAEALFAALAPIDAPLGKFVGFGNIDDASALIPFAEQSGFMALRDSTVTIDRRSAHLVIAGLSTDMIEARDFSAVSSAVEDADCVILLSYIPDALPVINTHTARGGGMMADLVLSADAKNTESRYAKGYTIESGTVLLVTSGLGEARFPIRLGAAPEAHLLTLHRQEVVYE